MRSLRSLPVAILKRYELWKNIVRFSGPMGLKAIKGFHDEALRGEQKGNRSSRLNQQYQVIYRVEAQDFHVLVLNVTAHDYRRK